MGICAMHMDHNEKNIENFGDKLELKVVKLKQIGKSVLKFKKNRILSQAIDKNSIMGNAYGIECDDIKEQLDKCVIENNLKTMFFWD